ncbi:uncharacterized protein LOC124116458 [Haliotis rufescens]|uniref:uncharacterized protein LOC124116458 n=1 Tax=Haliotis rufescens TaxID=6454 RepID=UPI001EAFB7B5|nr:uncharacterized protein LOC124116458 [Haliotis rufescens]
MSSLLLWIFVTLTSSKHVIPSLPEYTPHHAFHAGPVLGYHGNTNDQASYLHGRPSGGRAIGKVRVRRLASRSTSRKQARYMQIPIYRPGMPGSRSPAAININTLLPYRRNYFDSFLASQFWISPNPTAINPVAPPIRARFTSPRASKHVESPPIISPLANAIDKDLPVMTKQSSKWVWPNSDVTGPLSSFTINVNKL